jgi:hypothetical protein
MLANPEGRGLITHSIFRPYRLLREAMVSEPAFTQEYSSRMNLALDDPKVISSLLLQFALRSNSHGVVLFSTSNPARLAANALDAESNEYTDGQMSEFRALVENLIPGNPQAL